MEWYQQMIYDLLPEGVYIRCSRVARNKPRGFVVSLLHLQRAKDKKGLVLKHNGYLGDGPLPYRLLAAAEARHINYHSAFYLPSGELDEESAVMILRYPYLLDFMGFDQRLALPGESAKDTLRRLLPKETLNNIRVLMDLMI